MKFRAVLSFLFVTYCSFRKVNLFEVQRFLFKLYLLFPLIH